MKKSGNKKVFEIEVYVFDPEVAYKQGFTASHEKDALRKEDIIIWIGGKIPLWGNPEKIWLKKGQKIRIIIEEID